VPVTTERPLPLVAQIEQELRARMAHGVLGAGMRLPSIRGLADARGVSRNTVIEAYERLRAQGLVRSRQGSGYFVQEPPSPSPPSAGGALMPQQAEDVAGELWQLFSDAPHTLKLGCGWLPDSWREQEALAAAIRQVARREAQALFDYSTPLGSPALRALLQQQLGARLGFGVAAAQIMLTSGASHALDLLVRYLLRPGDEVLVESPGYYNLFGLLKLHGIRMLEVPRTPQGPDVDALARLLQAHRPKAFFVNSVFHNPTGSLLSAAVAHRILQLAEQHGLVLVEDDIYADLQSEPSVRLATLDQLQRVIYLGSFSKTLSCSLRVGYIAAGAAVLRPLVDVKMLTSIASSRFAEEVVASMIENGSYRRLAERLRRRLEGQQAAVQQLLATAGWQLWGAPAGGMFIWARRPGVDDSATLVAAAERRGISLSPGSAFMPNGAASPWLRINVAYATEPAAVAFLADPGV